MLILVESIGMAAEIAHGCATCTQVSSSLEFAKLHRFRSSRGGTHAER
jgi:hypothetical protein